MCFWGFAAAELCFSSTFSSYGIELVPVPARALGHRASPGARGHTQPNVVAHLIERLRHDASTDASTAVSDTAVHYRCL